MTQLFPNHGQLITISPMGFYIRNTQYWNSTEGSWISTWLPSPEGSSGQSWNEVGDLELRPMWGLLLLLSPTYYHSDTKFKQEDQGIQLHSQRKGLQAPRIFPSPNTPLASWDEWKREKRRMIQHCEWLDCPWSETGSLQVCNVNTYPITPITHQPMALVVTDPITKLSCQHWIPLKGPLEISLSLACFRIFH